MKFSVTKLLVLGLTVGLAACQDTSSPTDQVAPPSFAAAKKTPLTGTPTERAAQIAAKVNQRLAASGSKIRLTGASFFTVGRGVPPFRTLRTGLRWPTRDLTYLIDVSDFAPGANSAAVQTALVNAYRDLGRGPEHHAESHPGAGRQCQSRRAGRHRDRQPGQLRGHRGYELAGGHRL